MTQRRIQNKQQAWDAFVKAHNIEQFDFFLIGGDIGIRMSFRPTLFIYPKNTTTRHWGSKISNLTTLIKYIRGAENGLVDICADFIKEDCKISWTEFKERVLIEKLAGLNKEQ